MAAATAHSSPTPGSERQAYAPAMRTLLAALAEGRPATVAELAAAAWFTAGLIVFRACERIARRRGTLSHA